MRVGLCGAGVVGGGVLEMLRDREGVSVAKVLVRDPNKERPGVQFPENTEIVTEWTDIVRDDDINIVVELIGGVDLAWDIVRESMVRGKHVVTANKALVAARFREISRLAEQNGVHFAYEAAVAGGIPVIRCLRESLVPSDEIVRVRGIVNGTTNYMLTQMDTGRATSYASALEEAQALGYAEADPTADVEGHDARAKLCVLARLALGCGVAESEVPCEGITRLCPEDFEYARALGCTIKLVASCERRPTIDDRPAALETFVHPCVCLRSGPLGSTAGVLNVVSVDSVRSGTTTLSGAGAGRFPTAASVVADVCEVQRKFSAFYIRSPDPPFPLSERTDVAHEGDFQSRFFVRINARDQTGIIATTGRLCQERGIGIHAVLQNPILDPEKDIAFVVTTDECRRSAVVDLCAALGFEPWCAGEPLALPLLM